MPIIVKTPLRISLFGGGTDYREYFERNDGAVLGGTIDKFIYTVCLPMSPVAETRYRLTYSKVETINVPSEIQHPVIREVLLDEAYDIPFNLAVISDIPGGSGLGSSSSFTVGFLNLVWHLKGIVPTKYDLAQAAIRVESELLKERVGVQDQFHAAFGGFSLYEFRKGQTSILPVQMSTKFRNLLNASLVMVHTKRHRSASAIVEEQVKITRQGRLDNDLEAIKGLAYSARDLFLADNEEEALKELGRMLNATWEIKRSLSSSISNTDLDDMYQKATSLGVLGGKLAGAGGGGFFVFLAPQHVIPKLRDTFGDEAVVKVAFQEEGSRVKQVI